jgi:hypothetical protein
MEIEEKVEAVHQPVVHEAAGGKWQKRRLVMELFVLSLLLGVAWLSQSGRGEIWVDAGSCGFELYSGGYQNWEIVWSDGYSLRPDGKVEYFWHRPHFRHADVRPYPLRPLLPNFKETSRLRNKGLRN